MKSRRKTRLRKFLLLLLLLFPLWGPGGYLGLKLLKCGHAQLWVPSYVADVLSGRHGQPARGSHVVFLFCDHWEPGRGETGEAKAEDWLGRFQEIARRHADSQGRTFRYTWFYPCERREPAILRRLAEAAHEGLGEVELHWHHAQMTSESLDQSLREALRDFAAWGALVHDGAEGYRFGFIHGNWSLDNSRGDAFCGVSDEIEILGRNGCYGDFTFPAIGTVAQPRTINRIYYAQDDEAAKSYDRGTEARVGVESTGLMILEGPLGFDWGNLLVLFEYGALDGAEGSGVTGWIRPPADFRAYFRPHRVGLWVSLGISVAGREEWRFVKIHAHGIQQADIVLGGGLDALLDSLSEYCVREGYSLHYVTAREAFNLVKAAERGLPGRPEEYYDLVIPRPRNVVKDYAAGAGEGQPDAQSAERAGASDG